MVEDVKNIKEIAGNLKIDKKALAAAVGIMTISWAGLPIVYWLITHYKENKMVLVHRSAVTGEHNKNEVKQNGK